MSLVRRRGAKPVAAFAAGITAAAFALPLAVFAGPATAKHSTRAEHRSDAGEHRSHRGEHRHPASAAITVAAGAPVNFFAGPRAQVATTTCMGYSGSFGTPSGDTSTISNDPTPGFFDVTATIHNPYKNAQTLIVQVAQHNLFGCLFPFTRKDFSVTSLQTVTIGPTSATPLTFPRIAKQFGATGAIVSVGIGDLNIPSYYEITANTNF
jgi:hypothetical protein